MVKRRGKRKNSLMSKSVVVVGVAFWKRILAFLIDLLIVQFVIMGPFKRVFESILGESSGYDAAAAYLEANPAILGQMTWMVTIIGILAIAYFVVMQFKFRQTLGMMVFGIWVHTEAKQLKLWQLVIANLTLMPIFPFVLLWVIDPVYSVFSQSGQRLMQRLSGVYIIERTEVNYLP